MGKLILNSILWFLRLSFLFLFLVVLFVVYPRKLTGKVMIQAVFITDPETAWTPEEKNIRLKQLDKAILFLESQGKKYGKSVNFEYRYADIVTDKIIPTKGYIAADLNVSLIAKAIKCFPISINPMSSTVFCFFVNKKGMFSYASSATRSVKIYTMSGDQTMTIAHETLHLFNAQDLYFFDTGFQLLSEEYFPNDIMSSSHTANLDSLKVGLWDAYCIGWIKKEALNSQLTQDQKQFVAYAERNKNSLNSQRVGAWYKIIKAAP